ncbi:hypothetical protein L1277_001077 [Okibacterium sp. HSC-33S16]|uniref:hypothetical protein n=1 Tax=Okibacterium sp. HSC-33S16 TaxID=2910965 RepID=UPI00209D440E|nr:hypothetical protein [Okibacterium sp. HSC-33S16]MCP2030986.1 hypothetical protein [Okibacterium sp. HSC-33S16]
MPELSPHVSRALDRVFAPVDSVVRADHVFEPAVPVGTSGESLPPVALIRSGDLLSLTFRFVNLTVSETDAGGVLARSRTSASAYLVAQFPAQHLLERAYFESAGTLPKVGGPPLPAGSDPVTLPAEAILSASSRLVFRVTDQRIPFTEAGLLDAMRTLPLSVAPHADSYLLHLPWLDLAADLRALMPTARVSGSASRGGSRRASGRVVAELTREPVFARRTLTDLAGQGRLRRTASEIELQFGAFSAVAAVADRLSDIDVLTPLPRIPRTPPVPREPTSTETAIELPWRLQLSPHSRGAFAHSTAEVSHGGRTELWHTRLGTRTDGATPGIDEVDPATKTVRAVWTRDFDRTGEAFPVKAAEIRRDDPELSPFRASLSIRDRKFIVHQTSNFALTGMPAGWMPIPATVHNLMLTAVGGWLDSEAKFPITGTAISLQEWKHRATLGRDQYIKVVYSGVLYPFGHRASLVKVTERRVASASRAAVLFQRLFVVVRQPERVFRTSGKPKLDNRMPFSWVRILTDSTPPLMSPGAQTNGALFVPRVATGASGPTAGEAFRFRMRASDVDNHLIEFEGPLVFIEETRLDPSVLDQSLLTAAAENISYPMRGQRIAFAKPNEPDDTTLATNSLVFVAEKDPQKPREPNYILPVLKSATAVVPAMSAFTGQTAPVVLSYPNAFVANGFTAAANWSELFLQVANPDGSPVTAPEVMGFGAKSDRSGGFLSPSVGITALARQVGPVGGALSALTTGSRASFPVGTMFPLDAAKLFGILPLAELLPIGGALPRFVTQSITEVVALQENIARLQAFALQQAAVFSGHSVALGQAAAELVTDAGQLPAALVALSKPPHDDADVQALLTKIHGHVATLLGGFSDPAKPLPFARPTIEQMVSVLGSVEQATAAAAATVGLFVQFYQGFALPEKISARLDWEIDLVRWPPPPASESAAIFLPRGSVRLVAEIEAPTNGGEPRALVSCSLPPFEIRLMGDDLHFVSINVAVMEFSVRPGTKPDVNVELEKDKGIVFAGPLAFIETLKEIIPADGFSDPPFLDVSTEGIRAGYDLALPDVPMGIFALSNVHLGAELLVPFIGESLEFRFFFATRENPFRLQVAFFAGGGFFGITISPRGIKVIEASFEFGAAVAMSFVVASGSLSVMAGIYFKLELQGSTQAVQLTGYFRARGEVDVLGLISACIELYLELSYFNDGGNSKAIGKASISIEVSVCFLSFSVSVSCEKKFAGTAGDPTFVQMMGPYVDDRDRPREPWDDYCGAFAPEVV